MMVCRDVKHIFVDMDIERKEDNTIEMYIWEYIRENIARHDLLMVSKTDELNNGKAEIFHHIVTTTTICVKESQN